MLVLRPIRISFLAAVKQLLCYFSESKTDFVLILDTTSWCQFRFEHDQRNPFVLCLHSFCLMLSSAELFDTNCAVTL